MRRIRTIFALVLLLALIASIADDERPSRPLPAAASAAFAAPASQGDGAENLIVTRLAAGTFTRKADGHTIVTSVPGRIYYVVGSPATLALAGNAADGGALAPSLPAPDATATSNGLTYGVTVTVAAGRFMPIWAQVSLANNTDSPIATGGGCDADLEFREIGLRVTCVGAKPCDGPQFTDLGQAMLGPCLCAATRITYVPAHTTATFLVNLRDIFLLVKGQKYAVTTRPQSAFNGKDSPRQMFVAPA